MMMRIAKIGWMILVAVDLALYVLGGIVYYQQVDTVCVGTRIECHQRQQATAEER